MLSSISFAEITLAFEDGPSSLKVMGH